MRSYCIYVALNNKIYFNSCDNKAAIILNVFCKSSHNLFGMHACTMKNLHGTFCSCLPSVLVPGCAVHVLSLLVGP